MGRKWVGRFGRACIAGVAVGLVYYLAMVAYTWRATKWESDVNADVAIVLGAAQYNGTPSPVLKARLDRAKELLDEGRVRLIVVTGGSAPGDTYTEAYSGLRYLIGAGVSEASLLEESDGKSTWESLAATARILRSKEMSRAILVSDKFHSLRVTRTAEELGLSVTVAPTAFEPTAGQIFREGAIVSCAEILGYGRMRRWFGD